MFRCAAAIVFLWTIAVAACPANAQLFPSLSRDYQRNKWWPEPFIGADRDSVNMPFAIMVANGWRRHNLLCEYHFNEDTGSLNLAGETKVRYILTQMPPARRTIYVQRALTTSMTADRMASVQRAADTIVGDQGAPMVVESDLPNEGWPADEIYDVAKRFQSTRPDPRLSKASTSGNTGSGSGSTAGGGGGQ